MADKISESGEEEATPHWQCIATIAVCMKKLKQGDLKPSEVSRISGIIEKEIVKLTISLDKELKNRADVLNKAESDLDALNYSVTMVSINWCRKLVESIRKTALKCLEEG